MTLIKILYVLFMGWWRDAFGKNGHYIPVLKNRFVQHVIAFTASFCLCYFVKDIKLLWCVWIAVWVQIYWALGHGACFDIGKNGKPDEALIKRYEKMVGYKFLCKIFPEEEWYGVCFDFCLLAIRYTYPLLPIIFWFNPVLITLGLIISGLYGVYRYCPYMQKHRLLDVEIWAGMATGLFISFL